MSALAGKQSLLSPASELEALARRLMDIARSTGADRKPVPRRPTLTEVAQHIVETRRDRKRDFGSELFVDPAWDMMLDLFIAREQDRHISIDSLATASGRPSTTALRWVGVLIETGHFVSRSDPAAGSVQHVELSPATYGQLQAYLSRVADAWVAACWGMNSDG